MSDLEERFSDALHNTSRAWRQALDRRLKYLGVSQASWMTIAVAAKARGPLSQSELADRLAVEGATMVAMVDRLVKAGLVVREPSTTDRRVKRVVLTAAGNLIYDRVRSRSRGIPQGTAGGHGPEKAAGRDRTSRELARHHRRRSHEPAAQSSHDHAIHHVGDDHADARQHHRQRRPAAHARHAVGLAGPDRLGVDRLHRGRGHRHAAHRLAGAIASARRTYSWHRSPASPWPPCCAACRIRWRRSSPRACCRECSARPWCPWPRWS